MIRCFVIMPFAAEFNDVYDVIKTAAKNAVNPDNIKCSRLDEMNSAGRITDDLLKEIHDSHLCIADITGNNPNVMWEVGYATALTKPVIFINQEVDKNPFDIKDLRTIGYNRQSLSTTLREKLTDAISETLGKFEIRRDSMTTAFPKTIATTIAVTGSMEGDKVKCERRVENILKSYLSEKVTWLCGSFGLADECVIKYLIKNKQNILVIGYYLYDISQEVLQLMEDNKIQFIDAQKEQLPKTIIGPSERDLLFLTKSDLFIIFWNGKSKGSRNLIKWYEAQNKDHIVAFF